LIHLTGGRIETHFSIFGSLAFLAFYRDWRVLVTASAIVAADHLVRGFLWPQSVYGVGFVEPWRWLEHVGWVVFEDVFLVWSCQRGVGELRGMAERQAELEALNDRVEAEVASRTAELRESESYKTTIIETAHDAIITIDHNGRVLEFNPSAESIFGYSRQQAIGAKIEHLIIPPRLRERHAAGLAHSMANGCDRKAGGRIEAMSMRSDGSEFPTEISISPVMRNGTAPLFTAFIRDITDRKRAETELAYQAMHDALTGLPNRAKLRSELEQLVGGSVPPVTLALLMIDLDGFKDVNDNLGHHCGDLLLQALAPRMRDAIGCSGLVARLGGDEFGVLLPNADVAAANRAAEAILDAVRQPIPVKDQALRVGASIGVALYPDHARDPVALLQCADIAMYAAKRARAGYLSYEPNCPEFTPRRIALIADLRRGINKNSCCCTTSRRSACTPTPSRARRPSCAGFIPARG
jgi:diguanylate cyclase (GGDEF)-like protein/PAS domain S-box-containing protein